MFYTYMLASKRNGTLYVGSTDSLERRIWEHREKVLGGFTAKYDVTRLVWFEVHETREGAFRRERRIKEWRRSWKLMLIEERNPTWRDLFEELCPEPDVEGWLAALDAQHSASPPNPLIPANAGTQMANAEVSGVSRTGCWPDRKVSPSGSRHSPG